MILNYLLLPSYDNLIQQVVINGLREYIVDARSDRHLFIDKFVKKKSLCISRSRRIRVGPVFYKGDLHYSPSCRIREDGGEVITNAFNSH